MLFEKEVLARYRKRLYVRNDNPHGIFYFSPEDFPGLNAHPYSFPSQKGYDLKGWFYHYENPLPGRIVVLDHGMGNGHRAYMQEIARLARAGYLVFSYDHTGCMASGGESINGFVQSLCDLDDCLNTLKKIPELAGYRYSVIGHSWGSFSTMNIPAFHPDVAHVIGISGFISVKQIVRQRFRGLLTAYRGLIIRQERAVNPRYADYSAVDTLKNTRAKVLLIHSMDDPVVRAEYHFIPLRKKLDGLPHIRFLELTGKRHNPHYTEDAVTCKDAFFDALREKLKDGTLSTPEQKREFMASQDWARMCAQDETVWEVILNTLEQQVNLCPFR